ncbi:canalicular multispecific organic anion transporter 2 [Aphelenchoides avenae]|nr:canalicular multispecific organic anion transporter 2 [Aphelenchus avenae]
MHILDYLCGDPVKVLDTKDALNATSSLVVPHVDECVQHTLLVLIPCTFLLLFLPIVLYALYKSDNGRLKPCTPATLRIINCVFLLCNSGLLFFYLFYQWLRDDTGEYSLQRVSFSGLLYLTLAITLVLTVACRNRGVITSGVLFNFWLLLAVCGLPEFRYKLHALLDDEADRFDSLELWLYMTYYPVVVLNFLLSCFADVPRYHRVDKKACPELMTSFLNQITFHWFTSMAILGNRRALEMDDLWELNGRDRSKHLVDKWERVWDKHAGKFHAKRRAQPTAKQNKNTSLTANGSPETLLLDETERHTKAEEKKDHPSLLWPLAQTFKWPFLAGALYKFVFDLLQFVSPQLLRMLINFIEDRSQPMWIGVSISLLMFTIALLQSMVLEVRKKELVVLRKLAFLNAATALSWSCAPFLVAVLTFGLYVTIDPVNNVLTPEVTFVALSLFNILRFPLAVFAMIFSQAIQCSVSNKRLKAFLDEEEIETPPLDGAVPKDTAISIRHGSFSWDHDAELILKDINMQIPKGSLVAIVGRIGSGKSSLLSAILSEMHRRSGAVNVQGRVAYVPQQAWIQNLTLKANILFSRGFNPTLYQQVIDACSLTSDLLALPAGDETEIGEKFLLIRTSKQSVARRHLLLFCPRQD